MAEVDNSWVFSVWSAGELAALNLTGRWKDCTISEIDLQTLNCDILPMLSKRGYLLNVFSLNGKSGFVVTIAEFVRDLRKELRKYE